jgi:serine/threonine-protein kinase PknG
MSCQQPGCTGEIQDGYCNLCGMARRSGDAGTPASARHAAAPVTTEQSSTGTVGRRRSTVARAGTSARARLGAGLVQMPAVPYRDPSSVVMSEAIVAESRRFCAACRDPVGRGRDGGAGRTEGFCRNCGTPFSFAPKLAAGDLVAGQYEVAGCLAHGGLGWIYLARDRNVADRWVVLKGLLDSNDQDAMAAAIAERRFLAQVEHPNIVKIFNFVEQGGSGYIVMEYVGGSSLKDLLGVRRDANGGEPDPMPVTQAIAYMLDVLPALGYLHEEGLLFCDLKPENVIQTRDSLKLIDLGGVYRVDDETSPVYGTVGYQAPEIAQLGPSVASDLFTVARTLAVLCTDFKGYQSSFRTTLPARSAVPLYADHDSLYRFLAKATAANPDDRFQSASEMADQLHGVLAEVVAAQLGRPAPVPSTLFTGDLRAEPQRVNWRLLPTPQVAADDPAAGYLATLATADPAEVIGLLGEAPQKTVEVDLRLAQALVNAGELDQAEAVVARVQEDDPWEWRVHWYRGVAALAAADPSAAQRQFDRVYSEVPGELAPKLALGASLEDGGALTEAAVRYRVVSQTDASFTNATFGLARCLEACGDRTGALAAYEGVPETSSSHMDAQRARIRCLLAPEDSRPRKIADLQLAAVSIEKLSLDSAERASLNADVLRAALSLLEEGVVEDAPDVTLAGRPMTEADVRLGLEAAYRSQARAADSPAERVRLIEWANTVRPWTLT